MVRAKAAGEINRACRKGVADQGLYQTSIWGALERTGVWGEHRGVRVEGAGVALRDLGYSLPFDLYSLER